MHFIWIVLMYFNWVLELRFATCIMHIHLSLQLILACHFIQYMICSVHVCVRICIRFVIIIEIRAKPSLASYFKNQMYLWHRCHAKLFKFSGTGVINWSLLKTNCKSGPIDDDDRKMESGWDNNCVRYIYL